MDPLVINDALTIPPGDFVWNAVRASGPGGQNVNKVSSKVELRFNVPGTGALNDAQKERLRALARNRLDADGWLVIASQATRDQSRNLDDALGKVKAFVLEALVVPKERRATKPSRRAKARRLNDKKVQSARKAGRQRPSGDD